MSLRLPAVLVAVIIGLSAGAVSGADNGWLRFQSRDLAKVTIAGEEVAPAALYLDDLPRLLARSRPVMGLQTCQIPGEDPAQHAFMSTELVLHLNNGRSLRLRSDSTCRYGLPWNVTDGRYLAAIYDSAAGAILHNLLMHGCADCKPSGVEPPEPYPVRHQEVSFGRILAVLEAEWKRDTRLPLLHTAHLQSALAWMDRDRFERALDAIAHQPRKSEQVRRIAAQVLDNLRTRIWRCADSEVGIVTIEKPRDGSYAITLPGVADVKYPGHRGDGNPVIFVVPAAPGSLTLDFDPEAGRLNRRDRPEDGETECQPDMP